MNLTEEDLAIRAKHRARGMTWGALKALMEKAGIPDDTPIMTPKRDHRYTGARTGVMQLREGLYAGRGAVYSGHFEGVPLDEEHEEVVFQALVVGWELF